MSFEFRAVEAGKKVLYFIPAILFAIGYLLLGIHGFGIVSLPQILWLILFLISGILLSKDKFWGGVFGLIPAIVFMYMSTKYTGQVINIELPLGAVIAVYYVVCGFFVFRKKNRKC